MCVYSTLLEYDDKTAVRPFRTLTLKRTEEYSSKLRDEKEKSKGKGKKTGKQRKKEREEEELEDDIFLAIDDENADEFDDSAFQ